MLQYGINEILKKTLNSGHSRYVLGIYKKNHYTTIVSIVSHYKYIQANLSSGFE